MENEFICLASVICSNVNDLSYTPSIKHIINKQEDKITVEDYHLFIKNYNENLKIHTNIYVVSIYGILFYKTLRKISKGEEFSKVYSIQYWLQELLFQNMKKNPLILFYRDHPLIKAIEALQDDYSKKYFSPLLIKYI